MHLYLYNENCCYNSPLHTTLAIFVQYQPPKTSAGTFLSMHVHVHVQVYAKSFYASVRMRKRDIR